VTRMIWSKGRAGMVAVLLAVPLRAPALELEVSPTRPFFPANLPVVLRVLVRNPLDSMDAPYLKRGFWPEPYMMGMDGDLSLHVSVTDPQGRQLERPSHTYMIRVRAQTEPYAFQPLPPGSLFGEDVVLSDEKFGFAFRELGTYTIEVGVGASPLEWYDKWVRSHRRDEHPAFGRAELFTGSLRATTTVVVE
jgi:hypothetical protein